MSPESLTLFEGSRAMMRGSREQVKAVLRESMSSTERKTLLVFDDATGEQVDFDLRQVGTGTDAVSEEPERRGPGRPRMGVVAREVTLLPRHWEWLNAQPGGASVTLRRLVESARRSGDDADRVRRSQEAAFRFMNAMAGDEPGFEEACRALFARDGDAFEARVTVWPKDVADYSRRLAAEALS
jgi:hypothetical protein